MHKRTHILSAIGILTLIFFLAFARAPRSVRADLPPRPPTATPTPTQSPDVETPVEGSLIRLRCAFPMDWPWFDLHWQAVWTTVQWQDDGGIWHDVEGWRGTLDEATLEPDGSVVGTKTWWLGEDLQGAGPFRWRISVGEDGEPLATSAPFDLPEVDGRVKMIDVALPVPMH